MSHDVEVSLRLIGIGSPYGDDTIGWQAIERLREESAPFPPASEYLTLDRPGMTLIPLLESCSTVALIDAMQSGQAAGSVQRLQPEDLIMQAAQPSSHNLGIAEVLAVAAAMKLLPEQLLIYGVEMGANLSVEAWYPDLLQQIRKDLSALEID